MHHKISCLLLFVCRMAAAQTPDLPLPSQASLNGLCNWGVATRQKDEYWLVRCDAIGFSGENYTQQAVTSCLRFSASTASKLTRFNQVRFVTPQVDPLETTVLTKRIEPSNLNPANTRIQLLQRSTSKGWRYQSESVLRVDTYIDLELDGLHPEHSTLHSAKAYLSYCTPTFFDDLLECEPPIPLKPLFPKQTQLKCTIESLYKKP